MPLSVISARRICLGRCVNCKFNFKVYEYAHHLEQRTRTIIQGTRAVRSGWTASETNGSASGVFRCKRPKLDFVSWPGVPWLALTVNLMPSGHKCTHRRRKNAPTLRRVVRTYVTGGALWEVAGSGALPPDSRARRVAVCCNSLYAYHGTVCQLLRGARDHWRRSRECQRL